MHTLLLAALAVTLQTPAADPASRTPADAFVAAITRVCPIYLTANGLTAADEALLNAEMVERAGTIGVMRQAPGLPRIAIQAGPDACAVLPLPEDASTPPQPVTGDLGRAVQAWLRDPASGWTPAPTDDQAGRYVSTDGLRELVLIDQSDEGGPMVLIQPVATSSQADVDARIAARRQATLRPTDQAMIEAVDTLCAVASTPAWATIDRGEVLIRHAGDSRLTVDYVLNGDCTVRAEGADAAAIAIPLENRLATPGSGWTRADHAWMSSPGNGPSGSRIQANYRHDDGRELVIVQGDTEVQAILWQAQPRPAPESE